MDDFSAAEKSWIAIALLFCSIGIIGYSISNNSIKKDCENFEKFSIGNEVYECKLVKINSK